ncbi:Hypothetical protein, putative [Bodo saltans]|uniref:Uncharacterized protein n=1 Tax=Bodo saltans TaxID=75058 RepID=A0A0S4IM16_BODSA|nr:Hypothetical protein, putative [Bodo saltans]|eukprot:CUE71327.1 Hypothetical protein, putative [Bodo saltans]
MNQPLTGDQYPPGGFSSPLAGMKPSDFARTKYIPSLATTRMTFGASEQAGDGIFLEKVWDIDRSGLASLRIPVPADSQMDLQTFFFGPMTHSLTLRPKRPIVPGCCACSYPIGFDIANDLFSPPFATGVVNRSLCSNTHEVFVGLPSGEMRGTISDACCTCQPARNLQWASGEVMGNRLPPMCVMCGPWRSGYIGTAPGEEENYQVRYWDVNGGYYDCNLNALCLACFLPCKMCCFECRHCCDCHERLHYTSWHLWSLTEIRAILLSQYSFALHSAFGEPTYEWLGDDIYVRYMSQTNPSDINALGNWRASSHRTGCCRYIMTEGADVPQDLSLATGFDLSFRGTFNQNVLDPKDFNLALGYLILKNFNYQLLRAQSRNLRVQQGLGLRWTRSLMRPRMSGAPQYMAPPAFAAPPPPQM